MKNNNTQSRSGSHTWQIAENFAKELQSLLPQQTFDYCLDQATEFRNESLKYDFLPQDIMSGPQYSARLSAQQDPRSLKIFNMQEQLNNPSLIIDLSDQATKIAQLNNQSEKVEELQQYKQTMLEKVTEQDLMNRFGDYHIATTNLLGSQIAIANVLDHVESTELENGNSSKFASFFNRIKETIRSAFGKLKFYIVGFKDEVSDKISKLLDRVKAGLKDKVEEIVERVRDIIHSITNFFSTALIKMIEWAATIRRISAEKNFSLKSLTISIDPAELKTITFLGLPFPVAEFKLPKIEFEFGTP